MEVVKSEFTPGEEIELEQEYIVLSIPNESVEITITAKIFHNGELHTVTSKMGLAEIRAAVQEAKDGYIPSDAMFYLTPLGEEVLRKLGDPSDAMLQGRTSEEEEDAD